MTDSASVTVFFYADQAGILYYVDYLSRRFPNNAPEEISQLFESLKMLQKKGVRLQGGCVFLPNQSRRCLTTGELDGGLPGNADSDVLDRQARKFGFDNSNELDQVIGASTLVRIVALDKYRRNNRVLVFHNKVLSSIFQPECIPVRNT